MVEPVGFKATNATAPVVRATAPVAVTAPVTPGATGADEAKIAMPGVAKALAATPPVDAERVARIKKAIADGTFPIYPATIADRLIAFSRGWNPNDAA